MPNNFQGLIEILPKIDAPINILSAQGLTKQGLLSVVFSNAEDLLSTPWWAKFIEKYTMESPITAMFGGLNINFMPELKAVLPGIAAQKGGPAR
jgi:hypothetical protein